MGKAIASIPDYAWQPMHDAGAVIDPDTSNLISDTQVAEVTFTAFDSSKTPVTAGDLTRVVSVKVSASKGIGPTAQRITIAAAVTDLQGHLAWGSLKTNQRRTVPIRAFVAPIIASAIQGKAPDDIAFTSPGGGVLRYRAARLSWFETAVKTSGCPEGFHPNAACRSFVGDQRRVQSLGRPADARTRLRRP